MLTQLYEPRWYKPLYYASRQLIATERNYSTTEREAVDLIFSIVKFRHYLLGRKFTFHVDHAALLYIADKSTLTGKLARWALLLQEFTFDIVDRPGSQHALADYLSCLELDATTPIPDDLLDATILEITPLSTPYDLDDSLREIEHYLQMGMVSLVLFSRWPSLLRRRRRYLPQSSTSPRDPCYPR